MPKKSHERLRRLVVLPVLAIGIGGFAFLRLNKAPPVRDDAHEVGRRVRVLDLRELTVIPRAVGYGVVQSQKNWEMIARVSGHVVEINPLLKVGLFIPEGTWLIRIDPQDYELAEAELGANLKSIRAEIREILVREKSARKSLKIESRSLELAERELSRVTQLMHKGASSETIVDLEERKVLGQRKVVQSLRNSLRELPAKRDVLEARAERQETAIRGAAQNVARTELLAPYDLRIREVNTAVRDVVQSGQVLALADGLEVAEIPARFSLGALRPLIPARMEQSLLSIDSMSALPERIGLEATVRLKSHDLEAEWAAKFSRFSTVDPQSRTLAAVVTIDSPYKISNPSEKPPVVSGMYMEVELRGRPRPGCLAIPRSALRGDQVFVLDDSKRLAKRTVTVAYRQADFVCLQTGILPGEQVILTDLVPAIEGMLLDPIKDETAQDRMTQLQVREESLP